MNIKFLAMLSLSALFDKVFASNPWYNHWKAHSGSVRPVHKDFISAEQSMPALPPAALLVDSADLVPVVKGKPRAVDYYMSRQYPKKYNTYHLRGKNNYNRYETFLPLRHIDDSGAMGINSVANSAANPKND